MGVLLRNGKGTESPASDTKPSIPELLERPSEQRSSGQAHPYVGPSLLSATLSIIGNLESTGGDIQIDGRVEGEIRGRAIRIGNGAIVKGSIVGENVEFSGTIEGTIEAKSAVLTRTARITGDVTYQSLKIEQGAVLEGNCRPRSTKAAAT
jgi:cytoskeletal protein CcmA (bactofilin family)